jgi:hypothetical protein
MNWSELQQAVVVPGEDAILPDGRPTRRTDFPVRPWQRWSGALMALKEANTLRELFRPALARSLEDAVMPLEGGRGVLLSLNRGTVLQQPEHFGNGEPNALLQVSGVGRDPNSGVIQGYWLAAEELVGFASAENLVEGWLHLGGWYLFTNRALGAD